MNKLTNNKIVPKLRFPEFKDSFVWEDKLLSEVAFVIAGQSPDGSNYNVSEDGVPFYQGKTDFGEIYLNKPTKWTTQVTKLANIGDILMSVRAPVGALNISTDTVCIGRGLAAIQAYENKWFLYYFLNNIQKHIVGNGGSIFDSINKDQIEKLGIKIPKPLEQQNIASCLSSIDDFITAQTQKLEALIAHKKGLMQQLFPAEGETVPKLRFAEFRDKGEWKEKQLGKIGEFIGGGTPSKANDSFWKGTIPWISSSDISEDSIHQIKISRFITEEALKDSATKMVPENSILLVSRVGVGKLAISKESLCTSQDFTNFTPYKDNLLFLAYYLKFKSKTLIEYSQGMAIKGFTKDDISKLTILIPLTGEQQKIADCLSSLDELITAQTQKLDALKVHKKGLMQQLFPNVEEGNHEE